MSNPLEKIVRYEVEPHDNLGALIAGFIAGCSAILTLIGLIAKGE